LISYPKKIDFYFSNLDIEKLKNFDIDYINFWKLIIAHEIGHYVEEVKLLNKSQVFTNICWNQSGTEYMLKCKDISFVPSTNFIQIKNA
jgi:hypothetical protein